MAASIRFQEFVKYYGKLKTALFGLPAIAPLVSIIENVGPTWPPPVATSIILSISNIALMVLTFVLLAQRAQTLISGRLLWRGFPLLGAAAGVYVAILAFHTYNAPDFEHREVGGIFYTKKAHDVLANKPGTTTKDLIADMGNDADEVWTRGSLQFMRLVVLSSWGLIFLSLEFVVITFALIEYKKQMRNPAK